jgi:hypothetical protein
MPQIIELSDHTYERLLRRITSFSESAEQVVVRLLDETGATDHNSVHDVHKTRGEASKQRVSRAIPGSILPEREYWVPILDILDRVGGSAAASDVIEALGERMKGMLKPRDYETLDMGEIRWRNRARFARLRMTEQGLLSHESHRGIWEMTAAGRSYLASESA